MFIEAEQAKMAFFIDHNCANNVNFEKCFCMLNIAVRSDLPVCQISLKCKTRGALKNAHLAWNDQRYTTGKLRTVGVRPV